MTDHETSGSGRIESTAAGWWRVTLALCGLAGLALLVDLPLARMCAARPYPKFIGEVLDNAEPFGHAVGVLLIAGTMFVLDPGGGKILRVLGSALAGGMGANVVKMLISRKRPQSLELIPAEISETFLGVLRFGAGGSNHQSFPSGHTATAVATAVALASIYPRGRTWFLFLAGLVAAQRMHTSAHYLSDVLAGAAIGWTLGQIINRGNRE